MTEEAQEEIPFKVGDKVTIIHDQVFGGSGFGGMMGEKGVIMDCDPVPQGELPWAVYIVSKDDTFYFNSEELELVK